MLRTVSGSRWGEFERSGWSSWEECEDIDELREWLGEPERERWSGVREVLRLREPLLPPALRILGTSQSAPMAFRALKMASMASAGWFLERMPNCHFVARGFFAGKLVIGSGLDLCASGMLRKFGFNLRAEICRCSSVCSGVGGRVSLSGSLVDGRG